MRDGVQFGFPAQWDTLTASQTLVHGVGYCNTRATLSHAACQAVGVPPRLHAGRPMRPWGHAGASSWYDGWPYAVTMDRLLEGLRGYVANHLPEGRRVLDAGCGTGALSLRLAREGRRVVGIDRSPRQIRWAQQQAARAGLGPPRVRFEVGDVTALDVPPEGPFDAAVLVLALHEMPSAIRLSVLTTLTRIARRLMVVDHAVPMPWNLPGLGNRVAEVAAGPGHFGAFLDYSRRGGLPALVETAGLRVEGDRRINGGSLHVLTISRPL